MKQKRIAAGIAGLLLFISIVVTSVWLIRSPGPANDLTIDGAVGLIQNKQVKEVSFRANQATFVDNNNNKYLVTVAGDPFREMLNNEIVKFNRENPGSSIKISEEPASSGRGWLVLINALPFFTWIITLAVIVYAVRVLSRNKG